MATLVTCTDSRLNPLMGALEWSVSLAEAIKCFKEEIPDATDTDDVSLYLLITSNGTRKWSVEKGLDQDGIHTTLADVATAQEWYEDSWCFTYDEEIAEKLNAN